MTDPLELAVATAVAAKVSEAAVDGLQGSWRALIALVRQRLTRDDDARVLAEATASPHDRECVAALAATLKAATEGDEVFRNQMMSLWRGLARETRGPRAEAVNTISHSVVSGGVIQGGNVVVHGDINFRASSFRVIHDIPE